MQTLIEKLNYKGHRRIAILNADEEFFRLISADLKDVIIDREIDQRCPYGFVLVFVRSISEVEHVSPVILHNLMADGVLWYCYPKKSSKKYKSDLERDYGWKALNDSGLFGIRLISIDEDWSAMRFRNKKYIKSERFNNV
jgi:hypothetical protein